MKIRVFYPKAVALFVFYIIISTSINTSTAQNIDQIVKKSIGIDAHNHMDMPFDAETFKNQTYNLSKELKASGLSAISMTFCVDRPKLDSIGEAFNRFILSLDEMDVMLEKNHIKRALSYSDVKKAHNNKDLVVVQAVEGGHFIEDKLERIEIAYNRGLRHLGLLHDNPSFAPLGDIYTNEPQFGGLTQAGKDVIKECNRLDILIDLTHCSDEAINDALEISTKPIIISHTGLNTQLGSNERMAKMMMPRLISENQAKKVAEAGGVIGVWTHLADSPLEYAKNIKAMVEVVGINHVCIGTDTKMVTAKNVEQRFGKNTNNSWETANNEGFLFTVAKALQEVGFSKKEIIKITGGNYWRVFDEATKK